jgi:hypothetical protein
VEVLRLHCLSVVARSSSEVGEVSSSRAVRRKMVSPEFPKRRIATSDSWASVQYDDDVSGCMRDIEAYGV